MKYQIKLSYITGDSFGSEEREELLEYVWENIEIARKNLRRIEYHYNWYNDCDSKRNNEWKKSIPPFCVPNDLKWKPTSKYDYSILLLTDDGRSEYRLYPFWCGYFERLHYAEIVVSGEDENKIWFH